MKKIVSILILSIITLSSVFAMEFNGIVSASSELKNDSTTQDFVVREIDTINLSLKVPFSNDGSDYFISELTLYNDMSSNSTEDFFFINLSLFKMFFSGTYDFGTVYGSLGRFNISDASGIIFNQACDGGFFGIRTKHAEGTLYLGSTGLLNGHATTMFTSKGESVAIETPVYGFALPYTVYAASISVPYLYRKQSIALETYGFIYMNGMRSNPYSDNSRFVTTLTLNGPIFKNVFYHSTNTFEVIENVGTAVLLQDKIGCYLKQNKMKLIGSFVYASGKNGNFVPLVPVTYIQSTYSNQTDVYCGIMKTGLMFSALPNEKTSIALSFDFVNDCKSDNVVYDGFQIATVLEYKIFSDMKVSALGTLYFAEDEKRNKYSVTIFGTLAF